MTVQTAEALLLEVQRRTLVFRRLTMDMFDQVPELTFASGSATESSTLRHLLHSMGDCRGVWMTFAVRLVWV